MSYPDNQLLGGRLGGFGGQAAAAQQQRPQRTYVSLSDGYDYDRSFIVNHVPGTIEKRELAFGADYVRLGCTEITAEAFEAMWAAYQKTKEKK